MTKFNDLLTAAARRALDSASDNLSVAPKNVYPELVKPLLPSVSNTDVPSTSNNCIVFERTEVKSSYVYELNTEEDMDISLISVGQGSQKSENIHKQELAGCNNSANDEDDIASLLPVDSSSTSPSINIESTSDTFSVKKPCMNSKHEISLMDASRIHTSDTPRRRFLKREIQALKGELAIKDMKLKTVRQTVRRQKKKIASIKTIITKLQNENLINEDVGFTLLESFGNKQDLIINWAKKNMGNGIEDSLLGTNLLKVKGNQYI
ncbi:uncharacterized protein LOC132951314 [Metopolophium dirhodum]|uniref:uncharacterized protein LOC132951314 n=1 Tax=Metopolophium dirhodum TaxID=44670 RepID=UPI00298F5B2D|nr:uncharacterized protein LOC132951314 [Metopolophium dirhodum]